MRHFLRHFFVPHHTNNHRAKALHLDTMLLYVLLVVVFNLAVRLGHEEFPTVLGYATDIRLEQLLTLTNKERTTLNLTPLTFNTTLSKAATKKAEDMFANGYWAHNSPQGKTPWDFIVASGYSYTMAGENLAKNFSTSKGVVDAWMASPTHKDNIVKPGYREVGFAIVNGVLNGEETTLVVQMFGTSDKVAVEKEEKPVVVVPTGEPRALGEAVVNTTSVPATASQLNMAATLSSIIEKPLVNIPTITKEIVFVFLGALIIILLIDGLFVYKKRLVRVSGNAIAHALFLTAICIILFLIKRGSLV